LGYIHKKYNQATRVSALHRGDLTEIFLAKREKSPELGDPPYFGEI